MFVREEHLHTQAAGYNEQYDQDMYETDLGIIKQLACRIIMQKKKKILKYGTQDEFSN